MTDRGLTAPSITSLGASSVEFYHLVHFAFATPLHYTTAPRDLDLSGDLDVSAVETVPSSLTFSSDGTKLYVLGYANNTIYQYDLRTAWDINTASLSPNSFFTGGVPSTSSADGIAFSSDGTKVYVLGSISWSIYQYTLSTAWDISTASYDSKSFSVVAEDIVPADVQFDSTGTRMYMCGSDNNSIYQYTLSTAWDISTASYALKSFSASSQDTNITGISFSQDGTNAYILGNSNDSIFQYTLSTAWDISTASYASKSFSVVAEDSTPLGVAISSHGAKVYIIGNGGDKVHQYTLSTAWDISTSYFFGAVYESNAIISKIPDFKESLKIKPSTISIDFSGAAQASHALPLTGNYKNTEVFIHRYLPATGEAFLVFKGFIDSYESSENIKQGTSKLTWKIANHWADWEASNGRLLTDENQQELFPGDLGLQFTGVTAPILEYWGNIKKWEVKLNTINPNAFGQEELAGVNFTGTFAAIAAGYTIFRENLRDQTGLYDWESLAVSAGKLPVIYGEAATPGVPVFRDLSGANVQYLSVVYALSEGECDSLTDVLFDGVSYTHASISSNVSVAFHSGTDIQTVDTTLDTDSVEWTSAHRLRGICYAVVKYTYNKAVWSGEPTPQFIVKGKKCIPVEGGTAVWTDDFVAILQDYLTNTTYGKGLAVTELDDFAAGSTYATATVTDHDGGDGGTPVSIQRFAFNGILHTTDSLKKNTEEILSTGLASLPWVSGKYKLVILRDDSTASFTFDADNITDTFEVKEAGIRSYANSVYYSFIDPIIDYAQSTVFTTLAQSVIDAEDNGRPLRKNTGSKYETNRYRAQNRSNTILKLSRDQLSCSIVSSKADSIRNEPGNIVNVTRDTQAWTNKLFQITDMTMLKSGGCKFELGFYDPTNLQWSVPAEFNPPANTVLTDPRTVVAPTALVLSDSQFTTTDGTSLDRIKVSFTFAVDAYIDRYEVWFKTVDDTEYTKLTRLEPDENTAYLTVTPEKQYNFQVYAVNSLSVRSSVLSGNWTYTTRPTIGYDGQVLTTDGYNNDTFYWLEKFDSSATFSSVSNATIVDKGIKSSVNTSGVEVLKLGSGLTMSPLTRFKASVKLTNPADINTTSYGDVRLLVGSHNNGGFGISLEWNATTSKIDVRGLAYDVFSAQTRSAVFLSVNSGVTIDFECVFDETNTTFDATANGASMTQVTTGLPDSAATIENLIQVNMPSSTSSSRELIYNNFRLLSEL